LITWKNKPLIPDHNRNADGEGIIEKWCHRGRIIYIVAIEDFDDYWLIRHVGKIRATKEKLKIMRGE
jgi:hypothetical protein